MTKKRIYSRNIIYSVLLLQLKGFYWGFLFYELKYGIDNKPADVSEIRIKGTFRKDSGLVKSIGAGVLFSISLMKKSNGRDDSKMYRHADRNN